MFLLLHLSICLFAGMGLKQINFNLMLTLQKWYQKNHYTAADIRPKLNKHKDVHLTSRKAYVQFRSCDQLDMPVDVNSAKKLYKAK